MPPPVRVTNTRCIEFSKRGAAHGALPIAGKHVPLLGALTQSIAARTQATRRKSPAHAAFGPRIRRYVESSHGMFLYRQA